MLAQIAPDFVRRVARLLTCRTGVVTLIFLIVIAVVAYRITSPEHRARAVQAVTAAVKAMRDRPRPELDAFRRELRARTRWTIAAPVLAFAQVALFFAMGSDRGPAALIAAGASVGPRTTNGEWWRLVTAPLVDGSTWAVLLNSAALLQAGLTLERIVGPLAFAAAYFGAAACAGLASIWMAPTAVSAGASGAMSGIYGLLLASMAAGAVSRSAPRFPRLAITRLAPLSALAIATGLVRTGVVPAGVAFCAGLTCGAIVAVGGLTHVPSARRGAVAAACVLIAIVWFAIPLRGIADVDPEVERLATLEHRTVAMFQAAEQRAKVARDDDATLVSTIERNILPQFEAADARLAALRHVAPEDRPRVDAGKLYLTLRRDSWRWRAETLRRGRAAFAGVSGASRTQTATRFRAAMAARGKSEAAERAALEALTRIAR